MRNLDLGLEIPCMNTAWSWYGLHWYDWTALTGKRRRNCTPDGGMCGAGICRVPPACDVRNCRAEWKSCCNHLDRKERSFSASYLFEIDRSNPYRWVVDERVLPPPLRFLDEPLLRRQIIRNPKYFRITKSNHLLVSVHLVYHSHEQTRYNGWKNPSAQARSRKPTAHTPMAGVGIFDSNLFGIDHKI